MDTADSLFDLLRRTREGDRVASEALAERIRPALRRWASGRLPTWAREGIDTDDLIQDALTRTLAEPGRLQIRPDFLAYIRQTVLNAIRDQVRRAARRPPAPEEPVDARSTEASPLERLINQEKLERYEAALQRLSPEEREAIVCRVELGMSYSEVAEVLGRPSPDAARMAVARALFRLSRELRDEP